MTRVRQIHIANLAIWFGLVCACSVAEVEQPNAEPAQAPSIADSAASAAAPIKFHCAADSTCPALHITDDVMAPDPFRGFGDPSLEYDAATQTLWLAYTRLYALSNANQPGGLNKGHDIHLAKSQDGGRSFTFARKVVAATAEGHPQTDLSGYAAHEVSTLVRASSNNWQLLWLRYFVPKGAEDQRGVFRYVRSIANAPESLGDEIIEWARGAAPTPALAVAHNLSQIPELANCAALTEPALFADSNGTYLATHCVVIGFGGARRVRKERLVLLREQADGYAFVGNLLHGQDAADYNAQRLEQADISVARNGDLLLIVTPITEASPPHQGCLVFEITDLSKAQLLRNAQGVAVPRAIITADGDVIGPGLCTYDADSNTGVLLTIPKASASTRSLTFTLRATGVHP